MLVRLLLTITLLTNLAGLAAAQDRPRAAPGPTTARPTPAEVSAELFNKLDKNNDGVLVAEEISETQARSFARLLRIGDRNKDGRLTRQEFLSSLTPSPAAPPTRSRSARSRSGRNTGRPDTPPATTPEQDRARREKLFDRLDRDKDGRLTRQEFPESSRGLFTFLARRTNKRPGEAISRKEFLDSLASPPATGRQPGPANDRRPLSPVLDQDRDGRLSRDELARAGDRFEQFDVNGDGQLDFREIYGDRQRPVTRPRRPAAAGPPTTAGGARTSGSLFERFDQDGNGRIEAAEVPNLLVNRLRQLDSNGDGTISPEEFRQGLRQPTRD